MSNRYFKLGMTVLALLILLLCGCASAQGEAAVVASGPCGENVTWKLNDAGTLTISGTGAMCDYSSYNNTSPWYSSYRDSVRTVVISDGVTSVGTNAFYKCSSLTSVTIPNSVTSIGESAFSICSSLASITIPDSVTSIGGFAFVNCDSLTSITIPDSVTSISRRTFYGCDSLTSITIPDSVTSIDESVFYSCISLTSITIPDSVTSIGPSTFYGCSGLTSITIPDGVTSLESSLFEGCSGLASVTFSDGVTQIGASAFSGCIGLTSFTIPDGVTVINAYVFSGCSGLSSITIPDSVTWIGNGAFSGCGGLSSITIPDSVTRISDKALYCANLDTVMFMGMSMPTMGNNVFQKAPTICCNKNSGVDSWAAEQGYRREYLSDTLASGKCGENVTWELNRAGTLTISGKGAMEDYSFYSPSPWVSFNTSLIKTVVIADGVTSIGDSAFSDCSALTSITIPNSVTSIGDGAFYACSDLRRITIPNGVTSIGDSTFKLCSSLVSITIPNSVTSINTEAFKGCSSLTSITIPDSVTSIGGDAFYDCSGLTSITIPDSVTSIGDNALSCANLDKVVFLGTNMPAMGTNVFETAPTIYCYKGSEVDSWAAEQGYNRVYLPTDVPVVSLPTSLTAIEDQAFSGGTFQCVVIPDGCKTIGAGAFENNAALRYVEIPASVESIDKTAFDGCGKDLIFVTTSGSAAEAFAARHSFVCIIK